MLSGSGSLTSARLGSNDSEPFESRVCVCAEQSPLAALVSCLLPRLPAPSPTSCLSNLSLPLSRCFLCSALYRMFLFQRVRRRAAEGRREGAGGTQAPYPPKKLSTTPTCNRPLCSSFSTTGMPVSLSPLSSL